MKQATQTTETTKQYNFRLLSEFANTLKDAGFTVIVSKNHPFEWLHFSKDDKIGTVGPNVFYSFNFGTVHKPCRGCGTGYGTGQAVELTVENAEHALIHHPNWASLNDIKAIRKYKDVNDFISHTNNKWAEYYTL